MHNIRIGQAVDIHQLQEGRKLILGGVEIEHSKGLLGHSDADVLVHAVGESILGALALGDLGKHFPDTDPKYKGANSLDFLAERPKMAPHIMAMRKNIANVLHCDMEDISIKATRGEKLGFVGNEEGIVSLSVCILEKKG